MKKIQVSDYMVTVRTVEEGDKTLPYDVKDALINLLFHPNLKLTAREVLLRSKIADKIEAAQDYVLLEDNDYDKLKDAVDRFEGFSRNEIELINRVYNAEEFKVQ